MINRLHVLFCRSCSLRSLFLSLTLTFVFSVFNKYYHAPTLANGSDETFPPSKFQLAGNRSEAAGGLGLGALPETFIHCTRERPVLCLLLMLGTLWMGYTLYQFKRR